MRVLIMEWPNRTATIMSENGQVIWTFSSAAQALDACRAWHNLVDCEPIVVHGDPDMPDRLPSAA